MKFADLPLDQIVYILGGLGTVASFLWKGLGSVPEGELGVKCRWGRALRKKNDEPDIRSPGFVFLFPFVEKLKTIHMRERTINLVDQKVTLADGFIHVVSATALYRITKPYEALFVVENLHQCLENMALKVVQEELGRKTRKNLQAEAEGVWLAGEALAKLQALADRWGVEILEFGLTDNSVSPEQATLLTMMAGAELKLEALEELAEKLGVMNIGEIHPGLAAAFVGIPLTTQVSTSRKLELKSLIGEANPDDPGGRGETDELGSAMDLVRTIGGQIGKRTL